MPTATPRRRARKPSPAFAVLAAYCRSRGYPEPEPEFRFHPVRLWRWDAAWPGRRLAVEFQGGVWKAGHHTRGKGYTDDCEKYATAAVLGWRLCPVTTGQLDAGLLWTLLDWEFGTDMPGRRVTFKDGG